ncbi:MAG TPA: hypothetical protein VE993_13950 [Stellaceae bacterium]|nr:hypothetical protein [Stellaceae bacterium]
MLTIVEAQRRSELFLIDQMREALGAVEYELPSFDAEPREVELAAAARARVEVRHVRGASDATYLVHAFGDELLMQLQLNVHRFVVVYRVPALEALDASTLSVRLDRWRLGAEHAGWKFGWRDAPLPLTPRASRPRATADRTGAPHGSGESPHWDYSRRYIETYCYAFASADFLENEAQQLYWRTDIVQMTRYFMLEAARCGVRLSPRRAGFPV